MEKELTGKLPKNAQKSDGASETALSPSLIAAVLFLVVLLLSSISMFVAVLPNTNALGVNALTIELRQVYLVVAAGITGSSVRALYAVKWVALRGQRVKQWLMSYLLHVLASVPAVTLFYFFLRGFVLSSNANAEDLNSFSLILLSFVIGFNAGGFLDKLTELAQRSFVGGPDMISTLDKISATLGIATLDNYSGFVCLSVFDAKGGEITANAPGEWELSLSDIEDLPA